MNANEIRFRSGTLDSLRGLTLFSMIAYHLCWDLVYLRGLPWAWYNGFWAYIWQQSICCTFILLSGYCCQASRHPIRRGAISFCGGAAVSLVTLVVMPEEPVRFGVLTFLGTAALLTVPLRPLLARIPPPAGAYSQLFPVSVGTGCEPRLSRLCLGAAAAAAPWLVHKSRHRRSGFSRPHLCVLRLFRPAAVALSVLDRVLSLPTAAGDPRPAGYSPAGAVRYKPSLSAALSAASAGAVRRAGAAAHHFVRRSFLCPIN